MVRNEPRGRQQQCWGSGNWSPQASQKGRAVTALGGWSTQETDQGGQMTWFLKTGWHPEIKEQNNLGQIDKTCRWNLASSVSPLASREKVHRHWNLELFLVWSGLLPQAPPVPTPFSLTSSSHWAIQAFVESTGSTASHLAQILTVTYWRCPWASHSTSLSSASNNTLFHWLQLYFFPCLLYFPNWDAPCSGLHFSFVAHRDIFSSTWTGCRASHSPLLVLARFTQDHTWAEHHFLCMLSKAFAFCTRIACVLV